MSVTWKILIAIAAALAVGLVTLILVAPAIQRSFFYPKPHNLPKVVDEPVDSLLAKLDRVLKTNAPAVAQLLQPGLSDSEIQELESKGGFRLSEDIRALYRWHNGIATNSLDGLLPGQRFAPLEEVVAARLSLIQQVDSGALAQKAAYAAFIGHRETWVHVFDDGAGDGYFYDPERSDAEGAFFYHFAEVGYYLWFPSFRNFLAGALECYESGAIKPERDGSALEEDFEHTQRIWERFGESRDY